MKRSVFSLLVAGLCLFALPVWAESDGAPSRSGPEGGFGGRADGKTPPMMKADKDGDGYITEGEMLDAHKERVREMFSKLDADKDARLSREEMAKGRQMMREKMRERMDERKGGRGMGNDDRDEFREKMRERRKDRWEGNGPSAEAPKGEGSDED